MRCLPALAAAALMALTSPAAARMAESGAVMAVVFLDTSTEGDLNGVRADETARLQALEAQLSQGFAA
ncbi:MAG: hypothetical protein RQ752_02520, partial [Thermohalobaculum sp.]|nr:hypothetical protein [Thermohalobaculum sp.]